MQAILGTRTSADINLVAQFIILAGLYVGFYFARRKKFRPQHANIQTTMVLANLFFILFVMVTSFYNFVILGGTTGGTVANLMIFHGILGTIAEVVALYLVFSEKFKLVPKSWRIKKIKPVMRSVLALWTITFLFGLGIYYFRYMAPKPDAQTPVAPLQYQSDQLVIHADELKDAAARGSVAATQRHAEHVVNLIVGKNSADYGDLDHNGAVEDPGDGTGMLNLLQSVRDGSASAPDAVQVADQVHAELIKILADAKAVLATTDYGGAQLQIDEIDSLAQQIGRGTVKSVPQIGQVLGVNTASTPAVPGQAPGGATVVNLKDFQFAPKTISVKQGTTVTFVNQDNAKHTVNADDGSFDSKDIDAGKTFTFTFDKPGTYQYYCAYHGDKGGVDMSGVITVTP